MWTNPETGKRVSVWAFAIILSCSRWLFVQPVLKMDQTSWCASHVDAFEFFGGVPERIVCDNLKTGVSKPDLYDPQINRAYAELASFYEVLIDPARAFTPKDKPRIERPMPYIRDSFFTGREFTSLPQMQQAALDWCLNVYGRHAHRGIDGVPPAELFAQIERDVLTPLPPRRFERVTYHVGKVAPDCHVKAGTALYSVPWRLIGSHVRVRTCGDMVQVFADDQVVATHVLHLSGRATNLEHYPPHKVAYHSRPVAWCRKQAEEIGEHAVAVVAELSEVNAIHRLRAIQSIVGLRTKYPDDRINAACARAIAVGDVGPRTIKGILIAGTEYDDTITTSPVAPTPPAFLRGPHAFADDLDTAAGQ